MQFPWKHKGQLKRFYSYFCLFLHCVFYVCLVCLHVYVCVLPCSRALCCGVFQLLPCHRVEHYHLSEYNFQIVPRLLVIVRRCECGITKKIKNVVLVVSLVIVVVLFLLCGFFNERAVKLTSCTLTPIHNSSDKGLQIVSIFFFTYKTKTSFQPPWGMKKLYLNLINLYNMYFGIKDFHF